MTVRELLSECLNKSIERNLNESLNNADVTIYHNTSTDKLISMMRTDSMDSGYHRGYSDNGTHNGICFTRNANYNPYTYYTVRMSFNTNTLLRNTRGVRLIPYQDGEWGGLDEYEERLVSTNGKPFKIGNLSSTVSEVLVILDRICSEIIESGEETMDYINDLKEINTNNRFGKKLRYVDSLKSMKEFSFIDACKYIMKECDGVEYDEESRDNQSTAYCVEVFDEEGGVIDEFITPLKGDALARAEKEGSETDNYVRLSYGIMMNGEYEPYDIIREYGERPE